MTTFIWKNCTWIFSGVGVAAIGWIFFRSRKNASRNEISVQHPTVQGANVVQNISGNVVQQIHVQSPAEIPTTPKPPAPTLATNSPSALHIASSPRLSFRDLQNALESVPPLQQQDIKKHYIGLPVRWKGFLQSAEKLSPQLFSFSEQQLKDEFTHVSLRISDKDDEYFSAGCTIKLAKNRWLATMKRGTPLVIEGEIEEFDAWHAKLSNAKLSMIEAEIITDGEEKRALEKQLINTSWSWNDDGVITFRENGKGEGRWSTVQNGRLFKNITWRVVSKDTVEWTDGNYRHELKFDAPLQHFTLRREDGDVGQGSRKQPSSHQA